MTIKPTITLVTVDGRRITRLRDDVAVDPTAADGKATYILDNVLRGPSILEAAWQSYGFPRHTMFGMINFLPLPQHLAFSTITF